MNPLTSNSISGQNLRSNSVDASSTGTGRHKSDANPPAVIPKVDPSVKVEIDSRQKVAEDLSPLYKQSGAQASVLEVAAVSSSLVPNTSSVETITAEPEPEALKPVATNKVTSTTDEVLSQSDRQQLEQLKQRDLEVRRHEQAHATVGGSTTGVPKYEYTTGPDGKRYAISGEVSVQFSSSSDPRQQISDAKQIRRAATAPAQPSAQDLAVARHADQRISAAKSELQAEAVESVEASININSQTNINAERREFNSDVAVPKAATTTEPFALFEEQRRVAGQLEESRKAIQRDFGGLNGSNSISANFAEVPSERALDRAELIVSGEQTQQSPILLTPLPKSDSNQTTYSYLRTSAVASQSLTISDSKIAEQESLEIFAQAKGASVKGNLTETIERANDAPIQAADELNQSVTLSSAQTEMYQRQLEALSSQAGQMQEPGRLFTAMA